MSQVGPYWGTCVGVVLCRYNIVLCVTLTSTWTYAVVVFITVVVVAVIVAVVVVVVVVVVVGTFHTRCFNEDEPSVNHVDVVVNKSLPASNYCATDQVSDTSNKKQVLSALCAVERVNFLNEISDDRPRKHFPQTATFTELQHFKHPTSKSSAWRRIQKYSVPFYCTQNADSQKAEKAGDTFFIGNSAA